MKSHFVRGLGLALIVAVWGCGDPPGVVQGKVVVYDKGEQSLALEDERAPGKVMVLSTEGADMGAEPETGDVVRVAVRIRDGRTAALRVMNITKQSELRGGSGGH